jgi:ankyrin repeat protein
MMKSMKANPAFPFSTKVFGLVVGFFLIYGEFAVVKAQIVEEFFDAIATQDTNTASRLLEDNTNLVFARDNFSKLPLLVAVEMGNILLVKRMLELGADVNAEGDTLNSAGSRMTALDVAAQSGQVEICELLLENGANPNHRAFQVTTLHFAFDSSRTSEIARMLLEYGADPFAEAGYYKITPLELAINKGDEELAAMMLNTNRKIKSAPNSRPHSPTKSQAAIAKEQAAHILASRGTAMLSAAAQRGDLGMVQALLDAGVSAKTNAPNELPVMQAFAPSEVAAGRDYASAVAQWQQTSNELQNASAYANPEFLSTIRSREAQQAAMVESLSPARWRQIRELLIKNGAACDVFAATTMGDTNQIARLLAADKNLVQARDHDGQTPLHWAVLDNDLPLTSFWLQAGASPAVTNFAGQTPLHIAATKGLVEEVKILLAADAPLDIRDTNGWTPLDAASQARQTDCIDLLIAKAPPTAHPERGLATTLHEAAAYGNIAALVALLDTETNLEARNELGQTPLEVAVLHGHLAAAALLVDRGANVKVRDADGNTLLHQILLQGQLAIYDRPPTNWLQRVGQDRREKLYAQYLTVGQYGQGSSPMLQAASILLASGVDATATNNAGQTAAQLITDENISRGIFVFDDDLKKLLQLLGASGSNINWRDAEGNTALHYLANQLDTSQTASLIASGADVNATNNLGQTPLHLAAEKVGGWNDNDSTVDGSFQLLIHSKANVNAQDDQGLTPLHMLAQSDMPFRSAATKALLDAGANPNLRDKQGRTPVHLFLSGKWPWDGVGGCIDILAEAGANLSAKDDQGKAPLHYLAALGNQSPMFFIRGIGDTFILAKADINARDNDGDTPLHIAARTGTHDVFDWLVKQGADMDATNNAGETPRQLAMVSTNPFSEFRFKADTDIFQSIREGKLESVAVILKSEPDLLNKTNQLGQTPLSAAVEARHTNIVDFLDQHGAKWDPQSAILADRTNILSRLILQQSKPATDGSLLHLAATEGKLSAVEILLAAGADLTTKDAFGFSPLGNALVSQHTDVASFLTNHGAVENIFDAVVSGDKERTTALIGTDKSLAFATNDIGISVAEIATAAGREEILRLLLRKGVSPNFRNPLTGATLLYTAAIYNQTNAAELLLQHRAELDATNNAGLAPIHIAALEGSVDVLEMLLKHKVDYDLRTGIVSFHGLRSAGGPPFFDRQIVVLSGDTALHLAALTAQTNVITLLLKWGASVNAVNTHGQTPLDLAEQRVLTPFLSVSQDLLRLPFTPLFPLMVKPMHRGDAVALLEQAGGKQSGNASPNGMGTYIPASGAEEPVHQLPVLQTGMEYHTQGCSDYNARRFADALADFRKSCELGSDYEDYSYYRIWLIRSRQGEEEAATKELQTYLVERTPQLPTDWPLQVGRFLTGQLSESDFIKAADNTNAQTSSGQHCEAYFYAGSKRMINGDKMGAVDDLKKCLATNMTTFEEFQSASAELFQLEAPAPNIQ